MSAPDRWQVLGRWERVAHGEINDDLRQWLATVARAVLDADQTKDANARRLGIVRAVGLEGRRGTVGAYAAEVLERDWPGDLNDPDQRQQLREAQALVLALPKDTDPEIVRGRIRTAAAKGRKPKK